MMHTIRLVPIFLLLAGCASLSTNAPENVDLSGTWTLNAVMSDTLPALGAQQRQNRGSAGGRGRGGVWPGGRGEMGRSGKGGSFPGGRSGSFPGGKPSGASNTAPFSRLPALTATEMTIEQDDASVGIDYGNQPYRDIYWGTHERGNFEVEAGWEKEEMIVRSKNDRMKITETYVLSEDGKQLELVFKFSGEPFGSKTLTRVFDRKVLEEDVSDAEASL